MGFIDGIFGNQTPNDNNNKETKYQELQLVSQLDAIDALSFSKVVVIFKHSTRCSISRFALKGFENDFNYDLDKIEWYLLDLLSYRNVSNEIAHRYGVQHQSPQIIVLQNAKVVFSATHDAIDANDLKQFT